MATAHPTTTSGLQNQHEFRPYPFRDSADQAGRLARSRLDELDWVNHYCFGGRRDFRRGFRALVAGGGTGDASVFLAHHLAKTEATIVHLDPGEPAMEAARQRARRRGLGESITWIQGSLLDLDAFGLEPFDYISCSGVLHHLDSPEEGLRALVSVLKEDGALGLMVHGRYGRTGVHQIQELMRLINQGEDNPQAKIDNTREVLASLPNTNWLRRVPALFDTDHEIPDGEVYDRFLHEKDRAFTVPELYQLLDGAGLHLIEFVFDHRALYDPQFAFRSERVVREIAKLPRRAQQAAAELFWGTIDRHAFWASRKANTIADPRHPENVPAFSQLAQNRRVPESLLAGANSMNRVWQSAIELPHGLTLSFKLVLNPISRQFLRLIDGRRTMGEIVEMIGQSVQPSPSIAQLWDICCETFETLRKFDHLVLRHVSVPGINEL